MDNLRGRLEEFGPDLVVIDGWGWLVGHRESDPDYVKPALAWLKAIRQSLNCATIVIHHFKKAQFASRGEHGEVTDILDQIAGLKRLVDQAQTALVYVPIAGYDTFNLLDGRTNKPSWDPIKTVIDYDHTTLTHRAVSADEGAELFDPDTYRNLWGTASAESRQVKGMLNTIRNRFGFNQQELATRVGVDRTQISRWYSGRQNPSREAMEKLKALYREAKERPVKSAKMPRPARATRGLGDR
jgi:DNA-binding transcriptional regulator YiaG